MTDNADAFDTVRVLLVDDDPVFADVVATFLRRHSDSIEVETVTSAEEGMERLEASRFDCIVSDYDMPGMNGLEFLAAVEERRPDLPFILFTGKGSEEIASRAISAGVTDYLRKHGGTEVYERLANRIIHAASARRAEREVAETRARVETIVQNATDVILTIDESSTIRFANEAIEPVFGYAPEEVIGESLTMLMPERLRQRHLAAVRRYVEEDERHLDWTGNEFPGLHRDGHELSLSVSFGEFTRGGERRFTGIVRDVTRRKRREERLSGLNETLAEFMEVTDRQRLCNIAVEAARERLDLPVTVIARFDARSGSLVTAARTPDAQHHVDASRLLRQDSPAWECFTSGAPVVLDDPDCVDDALSSARLHVYPLGRHGVFAVALHTDGTSDEETAFVETVVGNLRDAFERVEREELLREREELLEQQNDRLNRLNRINDVIRRIDQVLVGARTREDAERAVCEELAEDGPYGFAWIGDYDTATERIELREWAGDGSPEMIPTGADGAPTVRVARTHEPVVENVLTEPPLAPWRTAALDRGLQSYIVVPLLYHERLYGVLAVYADRPDAFDELEQAVLAELGATIAHAINSVESKRALVSDEVIELELEVDPSEIPSLSVLGQAPGCECDLEGVVPVADGTFRTFFTLRGATPDVVDRLAASPVVRDCSIVDDRGETLLVECTLTGESFVAWLLDQGAVPGSISIGDRALVTVELSRGADVREFVELFQATYPGTELVVRRERERPVQTRQAFQSEFEDRLTPRQQEILRTAYLSGYFDAPRERTGKEIAASLDISQPTFSSHLRTGLRKLLTLLYEDGAGEREP